MTEKDYMAKKQESRESMKEKFYRWLMVQPQAIEIINFYRQSMRLRGEEKDRSETDLENMAPDTPMKEKIAIQNRVHFYERYTFYLRENTFLMLFSFIEEFLSATYNFKMNNPILTKEYGIKRFVEPYRNIGIEISSISNWEYLTICQLIRNALLHANGRISLLKNRSEIESILDSNKWSAYFSKRAGLFRYIKKGRDETEYINVNETALDQLLKTHDELEKKIFENGN